MTTGSLVCADSSILVKLALPEDDSAEAEQLWLTWMEHQVEVHAPSLLLYEFVSVIRQSVRRQRITDEEAVIFFERLLALPLSLASSIDLHRMAYQLAVELDVGSAYDAHYLALALSLDCEFWTADERLYNAVRGRFPLIRRLGAA